MSNETETENEKGLTPKKDAIKSFFSGIAISFREIFIWLIHNLKFIFIPNFKDEELSARVIEFEKDRSQRRFLARLNNPLTKLGILILFVIISFAVFAPWISDYTFDTLKGVNVGSWQGPSPDHPLGTTNFGRDILGRCIYGARIILSVILGVVFGIISAYYGGWVDNVIMFMTDVLLAFPGLILALIVVDVFTNNLVLKEMFDMSPLAAVALTFGLLGIPVYIRLTRSQVLQAKELTYVEAAKVIGAKNGRIMFKHILPNVFSPVLITFTFNVGGIILSLAGLSFLGFGDQTLIEWGLDIDIGRSYLNNAPQASFWPGMMVLLTVLGFMLVGDGLRDALDPKTKV
ncbi:MAG: ABC transporter permease [Promethearchaeota archaeon]